MALDLTKSTLTGSFNYFSAFMARTNTQGPELASPFVNGLLPTMAAVFLYGASRARVLYLVFFYQSINQAACDQAMLFHFWDSEIVFHQK